MVERRKSATKRGVLMAALLSAGLGLALSAAGLSAAASRLHDARRPLFVGFYDAWDQSDLPALPGQLARLDVFAPRWLTIRGAQGQVVVEPDQGAAAIAARAQPRLKLAPLVSNAHDDIWDEPAAEAVILNPQAQKAFIERLRQLAGARGFSGYIFDFENLSPRASAAYPALLSAARGALSGSGLEVWATATPGPDEPLAALARSADAVVLMAYDECWATSNAGPIAGSDWLARLLADRLAGVDPERVIVALAAYGYDWPRGAPGQPIGAAAAMKLAARLKAKVVRDPASQSAHFAYVAADGRPHQVWFIDAAAFAADRAAAAGSHPRGYAIWRLGLEDPAIWSLPHAPAAATGRPRPTVGPAPHPCDPLKPL